jgi:MFS family permease
MRDFFISDPKLLFYGFTILFFASFGQTFFISIFNTEIRNFFNLTAGEFGLVYALGTLTSSLILVGFAKLIDHIDLRIYSFMISLGLAIACLGMYIKYESIILLFFIIFGLRFFGQGAMSHAGETTMARYFDVNRGKAISVGTFGGQIGIMFLPFIAIKLLAIMDWRYVWLGATLTILVFFIPLLFLFLHKHEVRHSNFKELSVDITSNKKWKTREVIVDKKFYIYLPMSIAASFISTGLMFHQIFIINEKGWSLEMMANGYILLGIFSIIGLSFGGPIIDKFNTKKIVIFTLFPLFLAILILIFFDSYLSMLIYLSLLGLNMGIGTPFIGSLWAELYNLESLGSVKALLHACGVFASALSPLIFGYIIDLGFGILTIATIALIIICISTLLSIIYQNRK